uniref:Disintegrin domain-containing protein n=1 Tax=Meloidogyne hapla TaxID=6305 RepID=A0A1I8BQT6_MELHA
MFSLFSFILIGQLSLIANANQLRHSLVNKQFIDQLTEGSYEIIHPFQLREKSRERMGIDTREYFLNTTPIQHFRQVSFVLRSSVLLNQRLRIALSLNEHLLSGGSKQQNEAHLFDKTTQSTLMDSEQDMEVIRPSAVENCFYQGTVIGEPGSMVTLSTCDGLWGLLAFANGSALGIWPLEGGDKGKRHPHVLFRVFGNGTECNDIEGQHQEKSIKRRRKRTRKFRGKRKSEGGGSEENWRHLRQQRLFLDIALLVNKEMQNLFNIGQSKLLEYSLNSLNIADLIFKRGLNIRIFLNYFALIENLNKNNSNQLIDDLLDFTSIKLFKEEKDATIYLTNGYLNKQNNNIALNVDNSVCSGRAVGLTQISNLYAPQTAALSFVHSLSHILGLEHDLTECGCDMEECIMSARKGQFNHFPWHFSACSSARLERKRSDPKMECLVKSNLFSQFSSFLCGNGQLDKGEECDCGRRDQCTDPCCDPFTCRLRPHANCAAHEECCHRCHIRPSGHLCRPTRSICDVAERCDGKSGECPPDSHLLDGTHCGLGNNGQCWQGDCIDSDAQCRELWGKGARVAEALCFSKNGHALEYGNCGRDGDGRFMECAPENERCGLLQCHEGSASPTVPNATAFAFQFVQEERPVQCKVVTNSPLGFVRDGTSCGEGRVCIKNVCLPLAQVSPPVKCPTSGSNVSQCSGHGDCTSSGQCLCFDGWTGKSCDLRTPTRRADNHHSPSLEFSSLRDISTRFVGVSDGKVILETTTLLIILLFVGLLLLLLLLFLLLFYRRSSADSFQHANIQFKQTTTTTADEEDIKNENEQNEGNNARTIKFGQMPSWREEKRKRKTNKRVYDALQRITEANEVRNERGILGNVYKTGCLLFLGIFIVYLGLREGGYDSQKD